ncbi:hypothetical protein F5Y03DRAFT_46399 [Xylaria venustula]|nr:hypothetical protein F5Y03DRAFT_46399 [Xylaria venustula]
MDLHELAAVVMFLRRMYAFWGGKDLSGGETTRLKQFAWKEEPFSDKTPPGAITELLQELGVSISEGRPPTFVEIMEHDTMAHVWGTPGMCHYKDKAVQRAEGLAPQLIDFDTNRAERWRREIISLGGRLMLGQVMEGRAHPVVRGINDVLFNFPPFIRVRCKARKAGAESRSFSEIYSFRISEVEADTELGIEEQEHTYVLIACYFLPDEEFKFGELRLYCNEGQPILPANAPLEEKLYCQGSRRTPGDPGVDCFLLYGRTLPRTPEQIVERPRMLPYMGEHPARIALMKRIRQNVRQNMRKAHQGIFDESELLYPMTARRASPEQHVPGEQHEPPEPSIFGADTAMTDFEPDPAERRRDLDSVSNPTRYNQQNHYGAENPSLSGNSALQSTILAHFDDCDDCDEIDLEYFGLQNHHDQYSHDNRNPVQADVQGAHNRNYQSNRDLDTLNMPRRGNQDYLGGTDFNAFSLYESDGPFYYGGRNSGRSELQRGDDGDYASGGHQPPIDLQMRRDRDYSSRGNQRPFNWQRGNDQSYPSGRNPGQFNTQRGNDRGYYGSRDTGSSEFRRRDESGFSLATQSQSQGQEPRNVGLGSQEDAFQAHMGSQPHYNPRGRGGRGGYGGRGNRGRNWRPY